MSQLRQASLNVEDLPLYENLPLSLRHHDVHETEDLDGIYDSIDGLERDFIPGMPDGAKVEYVQSCCGAPMRRRLEGQCHQCLDTGSIPMPSPVVDGVFDPAAEANPTSIACWHCNPEEYPDGFKGIKIANTDRWLVEPS